MLNLNILQLFEHLTSLRALVESFEHYQYATLALGIIETRCMVLDIYACSEIQHYSYVRVLHFYRAII